MFLVQHLPKGSPAITEGPYPTEQAAIARAEHLIAHKNLARIHVVIYEIGDPE